MKLTEVKNFDPQTTGNDWPQGFKWVAREGLLKYRFFEGDKLFFPEDIDPRDIKWIVVNECPNVKSLEGLPLDLMDNVNKFYIDKCPNLVSLEGSPMMIGDAISITGCNKLASLKGIPQSAHQIHISQLPSLAKIDDMASMIGKLYIGSCYKITSLEKLSYFVTSMENFRFDSDKLPTNLLNLLKIDELEVIEMVISGNAEEQAKMKKALPILNRFSNQGGSGRIIMNAQSAMLDAGLDEEYASL